MADDTALLRLLAELDAGEGVALARLAKQLDQRVSVLLRRFAALGDAPLGGARGPGWVHVVCDDAGRWTAHLTAAGRQAAHQPTPSP